MEGVCKLALEKGDIKNAKIILKSYLEFIIRVGHSSKEAIKLIYRYLENIPHYKSSSIDKNADFINSLILSIGLTGQELIDDGSRYGFQKLIEYLKELKFHL
jgi:hypothetical protein